MTVATLGATYLPKYKFANVRHYMFTNDVALKCNKVLNDASYPYHPNRTLTTQSQHGTARPSRSDMVWLDIGPFKDTDVFGTDAQWTAHRYYDQVTAHMWILCVLPTREALQNMVIGMETYFKKQNDKTNPKKQTQKNADGAR
jgi:hypothetical protein